MKEEKNVLNWISQLSEDFRDSQSEFTFNIDIFQMKTIIIALTNVDRWVKVDLFLF